jgi:hypothetical protein
MLPPDHEPGPFLPPRWLRNGHLQTLLGASSRRQARALRRATTLRQRTFQQVVTTRDGTRLVALVARHVERAPLVFVLHGWLGDANAHYALGAGAALYEAGFDVVRLNLRDHGGSEHLNVEMFHSARVDEVADAIARIAHERDQVPAGLLGFSLGGSFALRLALRAGRELPIATALAVSPLVDPALSMQHIDAGFTGYRLYFARKWWRSIRAKQAAFPERFDFAPARGLTNIYALTDYFAPRYTGYPTTRAYLAAYTLCDAQLRDLPVPCTILAARDDPVTPHAALAALTPHRRLRIDVAAHGGHCAFLHNAAFDSFADRLAVAHFSSELLPRFRRAETAATGAPPPPDRHAPAAARTQAPRTVDAGVPATPHAGAPGAAAVADGTDELDLSELPDMVATAAGDERIVLPEWVEGREGAGPAAADDVPERAGVRVPAHAQVNSDDTESP